MMIDRRRKPTVGMAVFISSALATTCGAFTFGVTRSIITEETVPVQRHQKPLFAFASDRGEATSQYEHFSISSDPSSPSTVTQESTTTPLAPPPMARPAENNKLAMVDKNTNGSRAGAPPTALEEEGRAVEYKQSVWERQKAAEVQGGSLRTWSFANQHKIDMIQVHMKTDGRPMNANVELWQGPDNVPQKVAVYVEDGRARPFRCFMATPYSGNSISIRNTNTLEYPLQAILEGGKVGMDDPETQEKMQRIQTTTPKTCQGGAVITHRFEPEVQSVQVFLQSEGRPMHARIELIQGPNNVKQVMEVYTEEGSTRPFYAIVQTPGYGTGVVRIINSSTLEFPFSATVQPWEVGLPDDDFDARSTGGGSPFFEISGGSEGMGIGNSNLRSVGSPTGDMGGMVGSFAISGSSSPSVPAVSKSKEGGLAGLFGSSESEVSSSPAVPPVARKMISPKQSSLRPTIEAEESPIFLQNEEFAESSSTSSLSQETIPVVSTVSARKGISSKQSLPQPEAEESPIVLQNEEFAESSSTSSLSKETIPLASAVSTGNKESSKKTLTTSTLEVEPEVESPATPAIKRDAQQSLSVTSAVAKRYVPPPAPAPPSQKKSSHVFLDIDDAFK